MSDRQMVLKEAFRDEKLANVNGAINRMKKSEIQTQLTLLGLDNRGVKAVLSRRLKNHYKKQKYHEQEKKTKDASLNSRHDYFVVIDFEATCEENNEIGYIHEIIEFPAVLVNARTLQTEDEFHRYCRPLKKSKLSDFCQKLTGITQEIVDIAEPFTEVFGKFEKWLSKHSLGLEKTFSIATDGPWDMGKFLQGQCSLSDHPMPKYAKKWINIRKHYRRYYKAEDFDTPLTLESMLESMGMSFEGRPHSGIDDARNVARILVKMMHDGLDPNVNDGLDALRKL